MLFSKIHSLGLWMVVRVCGSQPFGTGCHYEIIVSGDKGQAREASRILVNACGAQGCIGIGTSLAPSLTLGCGTFGGTSTIDNVGYTHLLNIKRIAYGIGAASHT